MDINTQIINNITLLFSSIGMVMGLFFTSFLLLKKENTHKANIFLALYFFIFSIRMIKSVFYNYLTIPISIHRLFLIVFLAIGPSIWFYYLHLTKQMVNKRDYIIHYTPFLIFTLIGWFILPSQPDRFTIYLAFFIHGLLYMLYISYKISNFKEIKSDQYKWLLLILTTTSLIFINAILIFFKVVPFYPTSALLFSLNMILLSVYGINHLSLFRAEIVKYANSGLDKKAVEIYYNKLKQILEKDKLYLDPELSLSKMSALVGVSSKQLSQVVNQIENINYSQFIVKYRVEEAQYLLKKDNYQHYKIAAIAYESGFSSISSFNSAFKKHTGTTAVQYRSLHSS